DAERRARARERADEADLDLVGRLRGGNDEQEHRDEKELFHESPHGGNARRYVPRYGKSSSGQARTVSLRSRAMKGADLAGYRPRHFLWRAEERVGVITLDRPEKKNPLTFDSYAELRDLFRVLAKTRDIRAVVITGAGGNFCSGGDVHEIIGPLTK